MDKEIKDLVLESKKRTEYNENILKSLSPEVEKGILPGNRLLVRLFKFEFETQTEGGLFVPKFKRYETDGGRWAAKLDQLVYQVRGVVVKQGDELAEKDLERYKVGTVVWLPLSTLATGREFYTERDTPAAQYDGYVLVMPGQVEFIENVSHMHEV